MYPTARPKPYQLSRPFNPRHSILAHLQPESFRDDVFREYILQKWDLVGWSLAEEYHFYKGALQLAATFLLVR
jgi:hypothetical protein